jgi:hypothetical protein
MCEEVDYLALGMRPRICPAGASDSNEFPSEPGQCLFQLTLDRRSLRLELETSVPGALVLDQKGGPPRLVLR